MIKETAVTECPNRYALGRSFVPTARYTDPAFLERELTTVFRRTWQMACREEEIFSAGDYVEVIIGGQSVIVVRGRNARINAYYNSCRHRGRALVAGQGRVNEFRCPFHGWRYDLDGTSKFVLDRDRFPCADDELALAPVRVGTWGGWVFVTLDPEAPPLLDYLDPVPSHLAGLRLEKMRYKWLKQTVMPCNWKTALDAFIEGYHVGELHPQLARGTRWEIRPATAEELSRRPRWPTYTYGLHSCVRPEVDMNGASDGTSGSGEAAIMPQEAVAGFAAYLEDSYSDLQMMSLHDLQAVQDLKTYPVREGQELYGVYEELREKRARDAGIDWSDLGPAEVYEAGSDWHLFPNLVILPTKGSVLGYRIRPLGLDPDRCVFEAWVLEQVPDAELAERRCFAGEVIDEWQRHDGWGTILPQDFSNLERMTIGLHSDGCDGLRLGEYEESSIFNYHQALDQYMWPANQS